MVKYERRMLVLVYLLAIAMFFNAAIIGDSFEFPIFILGIIICIAIGVGHFFLAKLRPDKSNMIYIFCAILAIISIVVLYRIGKIEDLGYINQDTGLNKYLGFSKYYIKQLVWLILGFGVFVAGIVYIPSVKILAKFEKIYLIAVTILMPMGTIYGMIFGGINGAYNWVKLGPISFQPSEFGKIALILYLSSVLMKYEKRDSFVEDIKQLWLPIVVFGGSTLCMVAQADLGTALMFFVIALSMFYVVTENKWYVIIAAVALLAGGVLAYFMFNHVRVRIDIWLDPWSDPQGDGYQLVQGFYAIAAGGLIGVGLGNGYPQFIPECQTDFIYTVICEELGIIFAVGIMIIFFLLFYKGIRSAFLSKDRFSQLLCVGLSVLVASQTFVIVGGLFKVIPLTGITLPIVSYGGTSVLTMFAVLCVLQKISEEV